MAGEYLPKTELSGTHFNAYSGTSLSNYLRDAFILGDGSVVYDKSRNSLHQFRDTYFLERPSDVLEYAANLALETGDTPVILGGQIHEQYRKIRTLPAGIVFPVTTLWIPPKAINRTARMEFLLKAVFFGEAHEAFSSMQSVDPALVIREHP